MKIKCHDCKAQSDFEKIYAGSEIEELEDDDNGRSLGYFEHEFEIYICKKCSCILRRDGNILFNGQIGKENSSYYWYRKKFPFSEREVCFKEILKYGKNNSDFLVRVKNSIECAECGFFAESMMALRALFELMLIDNKPERMKRGVYFDTKIKNFGDDREFGQSYKDNANALLEAGHGAIHRNWKPTRQDVSEALKLLGYVCREVNLYIDNQKTELEANETRAKLSGRVPPST